MTRLFPCILGPGRSSALGLLSLTGAMLCGPASAQLLERAAFSSGATDAAGGGYRIQGTLGEVGFVGLSSGPTSVLGHGFWPRTWYSIATDAPDGPVVTASFVNSLAQNFPNPFRIGTTISFGVARPSPVKLSLFDVTGRRVATLVDESLPAGRHERRWAGLNESGHRVASGVYFYRLNVGSWSQTRRMLKLR